MARAKVEQLSTSKQLDGLAFLIASELGVIWVSRVVRPNVRATSSGVQVHIDGGVS